MTVPSELGTYLQRHREERGWTLEHVESVTRIRRPYLIALEAGDWDNLPPSVYTRGLLRNYARALGVSQASVLRMYVKERPHEARPPEPQLISQPLVVAPRFNFELIAAILLIAISVGLIGWVVRSQLPALTSQLPGYAVGASTGESPLGLASPSARATATLGTPIPTLGARRSAAPLGTDAGGAATGTLAVSGTGAPLARTAAAAAATGTSIAAADRSGAGTPSGADATPTPGPGSTSAARPNLATATRSRSTAGHTPTARQSGTPSGGGAAGLAMEVRAESGDAWLEVYTDGELNYRALLRDGERKRWTASQRVGLRTGNAGVTRVTLNGEPVTSLGGRGEVRQYEWRLLPNGDVEQRRLF